MILKFCRKIFLAVFTLSVLFSLSNFVFAYEIPDQKNILLLHSYNEGLEWTSEQNSGIIETIAKSNDNCVIYVEYMDWKNYPAIQNTESLYEHLKYKYKNKRLDLLITTDDAALNFALKNRKDIFSNAPIVFSGVNQEVVSQLEGKYDNLTGVIEEIDPTDTIKAAININPAIENVYVIFDNTESGISTGNLVTDKIQKMNLNLKVKHVNNLKFNELIDLIGKLDDRSMLFFTTYYSDGTGNIIEFNLASREISRHSAIPMYHLYDFGLNKGALGGNMMSGRLYGNYAAELAIRILNGEHAGDIPIHSPKAAREVFDYNQLKRFNIPLNKLPESAELVNEPFSFFETYRMLVLGVMGVFTMLLTFLLILLLYLRKIRRMRKELSVSNEELTQTYEELVATDDELRIQLKEISAIQKTLTESEEKYTYLAMHDVLTGLPNRRSLFEDANGVFLKNNNKSALFFIDMDNFKYINDTMGHDFGDLLIKNASERLMLNLPVNSSLYRLGGDEFILLSQGVKQIDAERLANEILRCFEGEVTIRNIALHITLSIGIAVYPEHGKNVEELIKSADIAMYNAKENGKNKYVVYDGSMNKDFAERMILEKHLHTAMDNNEFELFYQPQLDLNSNKVTGLEALLRWRNPELGFVSPMKFIKVAEDTHLIIKLGEWVLIQACDFLKQLHKKGYNELTVSVNISTIQIFQSDFTDKILRILDFYDLDPNFLELEITETVLIQSFDVVYNKLKLLREAGIGIALDDFGKGYSSLSYLKQLPISTLKIDKCFIDNVSLSAENKTITRHIINMGRSMGISVIAEGVELKEQLDYLKKYACDKMQGYLFSKPLPKGELERLLNNNIV